MAPGGVEPSARGLGVRDDYGALGPVTNLAARLCLAAEPLRILVEPRVFAVVEDEVVAERAGERELKGFGRPVVAYEVLGVVQSGS